MSFKLIFLLAAIVITSSSNIMEESDQATEDFQTIDSARRTIVLRSSTHGQHWEATDDGLHGEIQVAFMENMDERIVLATDNKGIFISDREKNAWKQTNGSLPGEKISALHVAGKEIFAAVFQKGIYKSGNEGEAWESLNGNLTDLRVRAILKVEHQLIIATDAGIFKSAEQPLKWRPVFSECQVISLNEYKGKIIAGGVKGVLLSSDSGEHWNWVHQEGAAHNTAIIDGNVTVMNISGDVFESTDWGRTWRSFFYSPREGAYVYDIAKVNDTYIMSNNYGIHRSVNQGKNWEHVLFTEEMVFIDFLVFNDTIYAGTRHWNEFRGKSK